MRCPFCGSDDTQVKDSRPTEDKAAIRRRRSCPNCGARFTTFERVQLRELTVIKSTGQREPFDRDKLLRGREYVLTQFAGISHVTPDYPAVLTMGFCGILGDIEAARATATTARLATKRTERSTTCRSG